MTKLNNAYNYNARVDEDFGFQNRVYGLALATLTSEVIKQILATWKASLDAFDAALKQSQKSLEVFINNRNYTIRLLWL